MHENYQTSEIYFSASEITYADDTPADDPHTEHCSNKCLRKWRCPVSFIYSQLIILDVMMLFTCLQQPHNQLSPTIASRVKYRVRVRLLYSSRGILISAVSLFFVNCFAFVNVVDFTNWRACFPDKNRASVTYAISFNACQCNIDFIYTIVNVSVLFHVSPDN